MTTPDAGQDPRLAFVHDGYKHGWQWAVSYVESHAHEFVVYQNDKDFTWQCALCESLQVGQHYPTADHARLDWLFHRMHGECDSWQQANGNQPL